MPPTVAELLAALPIEDDERPAAEDALRDVLARSSTRPVPTGRPRRLLALTTLQGRIAAAYLAWWLRQFFQSRAAGAAALDETHLRNAIRVLGSMGYLRGAAMKAGQILAAWPDVVPTEFADVLGRLHFQAPPMHFELLREFVRRELGDDPERLFDDFTPEAFAAASLGQVHHARRVGTGEPLAIKIQYPNIAATIRSDMGLLETVTAPMRLGRDGDSLKEQLADIRRMLDREVDYEQEADNLARARAVFTDGDDIVVPRVFADRSSSRVLTMDFLEGLHVQPFLDANPSQADR
ncbi:MAG: AarF/ABC1/UbiB kinase family protein, partial [Phycisphaerae bacterium]|nr:AarF/ABC1/UbiB kinase family protein [Phycisphaerae bacterium]